MPSSTPAPSRDEVIEYGNWGLARNTKRTYSCVEKRIAMLALQAPSFHLPRGVLYISLSALLERSVTALLSFTYPSARYPDPLKGKPLPRKVPRGILRFQGNTRTLRQPVTPQVLLAIPPVLYRWLCHRDFTMIWAAFTLAFFAFLRCSEFICKGVRTFRSRFDLSTDCIRFCLGLPRP